MRLATWMLFLPAFALAQASFPMEFPAGAVPLEPAALKQRLTGKTFWVKPAAGAEFQVQYQERDAYVNVYMPGNTVTDSAPWRVEGSAACIDFTKFRAGCSEFRLVGDVLYTKRVSNGEVVVMQPR